jgi:hypothetical protein
MEKIKGQFLVICALYMALVASAQRVESVEKKSGNKIPAIVLQSFAKDYPAIIKVKWQQEDSNYEAEFVIDKVETSVVYDASGNKLEVESEVGSDKIPSEAYDYIKKNFPGYKITETAQIVTADNNVIYELELKGPKGKFDLLFDKVGKLVVK